MIVSLENTRTNNRHKICEDSLCICFQLKQSSHILWGFFVRIFSSENIITKFVRILCAFILKQTIITKFVRIVCANFQASETIITKFPRIPCTVEACYHAYDWLTYCLEAWMIRCVPSIELIPCGCSHGSWKLWDCLWLDFERGALLITFTGIRAPLPCTGRNALCITVIVAAGTWAHNTQNHNAISQHTTLRTIT